MGLSLASIFLVFTGESIVRVFFITAASFGGLSLWGYTTKRDLTGMGSFLFMGLIGLILAMVVNIFLPPRRCSRRADFRGPDRLRYAEDHWEGDDTLVAGRKAIMGALRLYLDFINLFMFLLQFLGNRE